MVASKGAGNSGLRGPALFHFCSSTKSHEMSFPEKILHEQPSCLKLPLAELNNTHRCLLESLDCSWPLFQGTPKSKLLSIKEAGVPPPQKVLGKKKDCDLLEPGA